MDASQTSPSSADLSQVQALLAKATLDQPWGQAFTEQLQRTGAWDGLKGAGTDAIRPADPSPFQNLTGGLQKSAKNRIYDALAPSPLRQRTWDVLYAAALVPDAPKAVVVASQLAAERSGAKAAQAGAKAGSGVQTGGGTPATGGAQAAPAAAGTAPAPAPASAPPVQTSLAPAPAKQAPATGSAAAGAPATQKPAAPPPAAKAPDAAAPAAKGPAAAAPAAKAPAATPPAAPAAAKPPSAAASAISDAAVKGCLTQALASRPGETSKRYLGNVARLALWKDDKVHALARGIGAACQFYPMLVPQDLMHLVIAEGAQESTGDLSLNVGGDLRAGWGFLQVTPSSVVRDYLAFGAPILAPDGGQVLTPDRASIQLDDPAQNVAIWAWYTRNTVAAGRSLAEVLLYGAGSPRIGRDFGNAHLIWFAGPGHDRHTGDGPELYRDYHARIRDYFVQSGFGDDARFEALLGTPLPNTLVMAAPRPGITGESWNSFHPMG